MLDVQGTFVSQKINKIRWIPEDFGQSVHCISGSWDDIECDSLKVWTIEGPDFNDLINWPRQLTEYKVDGDVTEIKFIDKSRMAISTSDGDVRVLEVSRYDRSIPLIEVFAFKKLHNFGLAQCSCTALSVLEGDVATVGEEGAVNLINCRRGEVAASLPNADDCGLHCVCFVKHNEVMTGNIRGHMKIWDFRSENKKPAASFLISGDEHAATCLVQHPTQPHMILAGSESGCLAVWDLRMASYPTNLINAHSGMVKEIQFHHENPQKLLTCSFSGEFWEWNVDSMAQSSKGPDNETVWVPHSEKSIVRVDAVLPKTCKSLNSFDCDKSRILVGGDNEAIYNLQKFKY